MKTFLIIVDCKSFIRAAEQLNIAQTTVSARVSALEQRFGQRLFIRNKGGVSLTPAGEQLLRHAPNFMQMWQHMQRQVGVSRQHVSSLTIGGEVNLWEPFVLDWTAAIRRTRPDIAIRVHVDIRQDLIKHVASGAVDAAVMHAPQHRPGLKADLLLDEKLVLVTTNPQIAPPDDPNFVSVDWGPDFRDEFGTRFEDVQTPGLSANLGSFAIHYVLKHGGAGYFRWRIVAPYIASGQLHLVSSAPQLSHPIYVVSCVESDHTLLLPVLACLRAAIAEYP